MDWVRSIDVNCAQSSLLFGDAAHFDREDVCTCFKYANLNDEELAFLGFALKKELEDVCLTAAIDAICKAADNRANSLPTLTFTTHLMAMDNDGERIGWIKKNPP